MQLDIQTHIGQLFVIGFRGRFPAADSTIVADIRRRELGGVILFDTVVDGSGDEGNIVSRVQVAELCALLQSHAALPLLIAVDQEGGRVRRLKRRHGFTFLPSAADLGRQGCSSSERAAEKLAAELAGCGITCNFAPVADIDANRSNPVIGSLQRSFSEDAEVVTAHCRVWLEAFQAAGILGCLKHFPGHGSSTADSHAGFVDISSSWRSDELQPYQRLIDRKSVDAVMTGHLFHRQLDPHYPASLSSEVTTGILRGQLGYEGLVFTDDLQMRAITDRYPIEEAIVLALAAGADQLVIGNNLCYDPQILEKGIEAVKKALERGRLNTMRLQESLARIAHWKSKLLTTPWNNKDKHTRS